MGWFLANEIGIEYAAPSEGGRDQVLHMPVAAGRADDGTHLIVDELGFDRCLGHHTQCRTIRVATDGQILFDSTAFGIADGYGCLMDEGFIALLSRVAWEVLIVSPAGDIEQRIGLWTFSKRFPQSLTWTRNGTFLISFLDRLGEFDVVEVDQEGQLLWYLPSHSSPFIFPVGTEILANGNILLADGPSHIVLEIDRDANVVWHWGEARVPADTERHLSLPCSVRQLRDGRRLVADTRNHRVLAIGANGEVSHIRSHEGHFCDPAFADALPNGNFLICDTGNARVVEIDERGRVRWQYGCRTVKRREFSYPRSVEAGADGRLLVSDTAHDRVVEVDGSCVTPWPMQDGAGLFWPRAARRLPAGTILIADGRHSRVVEVSRQGKLLRQIDSLDLRGRVAALGDPHDARQLPNGNILIADSSNNRVVEVDWSGKVHWVAGDDGALELADPHSAQLLDDGRVLISDSGHNRVLFVDRESGDVQVWRELYSPSSRFRLNMPKYAEVFGDGTLIIVDTGHNRVLGANAAGECIWEVSRVPESRIGFLRLPRWAQLTGSGELLVSDHFHHRILHFTQRPAQHGAAPWRDLRFD